MLQTEPTYLLKKLSDLFATRPEAATQYAAVSTILPVVPADVELATDDYWGLAYAIAASQFGSCYRVRPGMPSVGDTAHVGQNWASSIHWEWPSYPASINLNSTPDQCPVASPMNSLNPTVSMSTVSWQSQAPQRF